MTLISWLLTLAGDPLGLRSVLVCKPEGPETQAGAETDTKPDFYFTISRE